MQKLLRLGYRSPWLVGALATNALDFLFTSLRHGGRPSKHARTVWLQRSAARTLRVMVGDVEMNGPTPRAGLLVSNHLSYVDILLLASIVPAVFVSKSEVRNWPVFGWFSRLAGTIFVDRTRRTHVAQISAEIDAHLEAGHVVILFPEGTSSNGRDVLPFRSSLLEPVSDAPHALFAAHIAYFLRGGSVENDVCYWGDMTLLPHLIKLLSQSRIQARVRFSQVAVPAADRKELARQLHAEVRRLKTAGD
jgi:1-acyl-sn-glycerol-3-phosphate acyltransferase